MTSCSQSCLSKLKCLRAVIQRRIDACFFFVIFPPVLLIEVIILYLFLLWWGGAILRTILLLHAAWAMYDPTPSRGGWGPWFGASFFKNLRLWNFVTNFFPVSIIKTVELSPKNNYVFCCHPHGIMSVGVCSIFVGNGCDTTGTFPGIHVSVMTLPMLFKVPIYREWIMAHCLAPCYKKTCHAVLSQPGRSIALVVGGAAESLDARSGVMAFTLKKRKGFIKVAMRAGAHLVPMLMFGENEIFDQASNAEGTWLRRVQDTMRKYLKFALPLFYGQGFFQPYFGLAPRPYPINAVVGAPIECPHMEDPDDETVDRIHKQYMDAVRKLHAENHEQYAGPRGAKTLVIK